MIWWWAVALIAGVAAKFFEIYINPAVLLGVVIISCIYVVAVNMDKQHDEQMAKLRDLEDYLRSIENRLP